MNKKYLDLIDKLQKTLDDSGVKNNKELTDVLIMYKDKLEKNEEYRFICTKLANYIARYLRRNKFKAPKAVMELYNYMGATASTYMGFSLLPTWF